MCAEVLDNIDAAPIGVSPDEQARRHNIMQKRTGQELRDKWAQADAASYAAQIDSISPERITEPRCHVCTHEHRDFIEHFIELGYGDTHIANHVPADKNGQTLDPRSIKSHTVKHMKLEAQRIRAELEEEALAIQQNPEGARGVVTERGMLKVMIRGAFEKAQRGEISMEVRDMIQAMKLLNDLEVKTAGDRVEQYEMEMRLFLRALHSVLTEDQRREVAEEVHRLRTLDNIEIQVENVLLDSKQIPETVDAEIVDA